MDASKKVILMRFARATGALVVASAAAWVVGPEALSLIPEGYQFLVVGIVGPALLALEKFLRDGGDANA